MSALQALQDYTSSSDENDEESAQSPQHDANRELPKPDMKGQVLPPLPSELLRMFEDPAKTQPVEGGTSDPSMHHDGRVRSFEHVAGNWATYVHIPVDLTEPLQSLMEDLLSSLPSGVDMKPVPDLHISISQTVALQYQWIEPFVDSMQQRLASVSGFTYCFQEAEFYSNDEKTRSFVGLKVGHGHQEMMALVQIIDACLQEFSLPAYYKDPSFHVSFGWCLGDYRQVLGTSAVSTIKEKCLRLCGRDLWPVTVSEVWCKAGCKQFRVPLGR